MNTDLKKYFDSKGPLAARLSQYEERKGQTRMAEAVAKALKEKSLLIVEAGTGTGKTLAYLIPALLSGLKVVVSTGTKNLQEQIYFKDIPLIASIVPSSFRTCLMKGRNNYLCLHRFQNLIRQSSLFQLDPLWETVENWVRSTKTGDRSEIDQLPDNSSLWYEISCRSETCLGQRCHYYNSCFLNRLKQRAATANLIIVNHHLFMADLAVKDESHGEIIPAYEAVVFDEAHDLEQTATHYFGVLVNNYRFDELVKDLERELGKSRIQSQDLTKSLDSLKRMINTFFSRSNWEEGKYRISPQKAQSLADTKASLLNILILVRAQIENHPKISEELRLGVRRAQELSHDLEFVMAMNQDDWVYWVESSLKGVFLNAYPIDVSDVLREKIFSLDRPVILTSATLSTGGDFKYLKKRLGLPKAEELILPPEFDYTCQSALYIPHKLPEPNDQGFIERAIKEILGILDFTKGRAFLLFTSYRNLELVYDQLVKNSLPYRLLKQGEMNRNTLLRIFREDVTSVLLATSSFWQGVDVQGESLSCVVIDKLPFASPGDPLVEARIEAIKKRGGNPFLEYQVPEAIIALKQGLGRLIRNKSDKGLMSILDSRLLTKRYGSTFLKSLPPSPLFYSLEEVQKHLTLE